MGKGDERRPTAVSDEEFDTRWAKTFRLKAPAPPREGPEPHNGGSESFGEREYVARIPPREPGFALLLGRGYEKIEEEKDE